MNKYEKLINALRESVYTDLESFYTVDTNVMRGTAIFQEEEFTVLVNTDENDNMINAMQAIVEQILSTLDKRTLDNYEGRRILERVKDDGLEGQDITELYYSRELCQAGLKHIQENMTILKGEIKTVGDTIQAEATVSYNGVSQRLCAKTSNLESKDLSDFSEEFAKKILFYVNTNAYDIVTGNELTWGEEALLWIQFYLELNDYNLKHANFAWQSLGLSSKSTRDIDNENARWVLDAVNSEMAKEVPLTAVYLDKR